MPATFLSLWITTLVLQLGIAWAAGPACESMTSCDLYAELQEHSKRITGFSYNVKKADNALTQLRTEKINLAKRVLALEEELKEGENDTLLLSNQEALNKLTQQDKELETGMHTLSTKLSELKEEVNVIFLDNIRNNDNDLLDLQARVTQLSEQVARLDAVVKNHTENFGLLTSPENPEMSESDQRQVSTMKMKHSRLESELKEMAKSCGGGGEVDSLDSLGMELETVKLSYDTLQDQVTELQQNCVNQNEQLEGMLEQLAARVEQLEQAEEKNGKQAGGNNVRSRAGSDGDKVAVVRLSSPP